MKEYISNKNNNIKKAMFLAALKKSKLSLIKGESELGIIIEFRDKSGLVLQSNGNKIGNSAYFCHSEYSENKKEKIFDINLLEWNLISRVFIFTYGEIKENQFSLKIATNHGDKISIENKKTCRKKRVLLIAALSNVDNRVNISHIEQEFFNETEMSIEHGIGVTWVKAMD